MLNLCFHGIGEPTRVREAGEAAYWVTREHFMLVLDEVTGRSDVLVTFDDGNVSDIEIALPALLERGLPGAFFVVADRLDTRGSLASADLRELTRVGMTVGSHGMQHVPWVGLNAAALDLEIGEARHRIAAASGVPVSAAALPLGRYDRGVLAKLRRFGYQRVYTSDRGHAGSNHWLQPRFSVRAADTLEELRARVLGPPRWPAQLSLHARSSLKRLL